MSNSLGSFTFIRIDDGDFTPNVLKREASLVMRPGVPGTGVIDMGTRGQPFELPTMRDVSGRSTAETLLKSYRDAISEDKLDLVWSGINYTSVHSTQYIIIGVGGERIQTVAQTSGGLVGGDQLVYAVFTLVPVTP